MDQAATGPAERSFAPLTVIAVCFTIAVLEGYDIQAMGVAAPTLAPALHLARDQVGVAASAAMVG
jgi:AAHS family 3-hydroxyphenylpropionic acid transporter